MPVFHSCGLFFHTERNYCYTVNDSSPCKAFKSEYVCLISALSLALQLLAFTFGFLFRFCFSILFYSTFLVSFSCSVVFSLLFFAVSIRFLWIPLSFGFSALVSLPFPFPSFLVLFCSVSIFLSFPVLLLFLLRFRLFPVKNQWQ